MVGAVPATDVQFLPGALAESPTWLERFPDTRQVVVVTSRTVGQRHARDALKALISAPVPVHVLWVPDGERAKSLAVVRRCYRSLLDLGFGRNDTMVSLGGGSVGDIAGFLASTWHRGTNLVHLPTTLLAQVDACIGGKTAINLDEARNAVGTFYDPTVVVIDCDVLDTLTERDFASGLAEIIKCGFVADPQILDWVRDVSDRSSLAASAVLERCVRASIDVKTGLVSGDRGDRSSRMLLNYGHTVGQAIESASGFQRYRHGEAVGLGMMVAARVGELLGLSKPGLTAETRELLAGCGLPRSVEALTFAEVAPRLALDKKSVGGAPAFIVVERPGAGRIVTMPTYPLLAEAFQEIV